MTEKFDELKKLASEQWDNLESGFLARIRVGNGICGHAAGSEGVLTSVKDELAKRNLNIAVHEVGCIGLCFAEPLLDIQKPGEPRIFLRNVTPEQIPGIVDSLENGNLPNSEQVLGSLGEGTISGVTNFDDIPSWSYQVRIATRNCGTIDPGNLNHYISQGGYEALDKALTGFQPQELLDEISKSGLRGRGGAAFPTGTKLGFLARTPGDVKYILVNCEEGDPGAYNDKGILESDPHTLIEGLTIAAYATGATYGYVFIRHGHDGPIDQTRAAIEAAREAGLLGEKILGTDFSFDAEVALTGESYVAGEETALMEAIEGKRSMPRFRPPFPAQVGLWGKPSNINNVKTLSYIPEIIRKGGEWFSSIGYGRSKGTAIICMTGDVALPGMYEVPFGLTLGQVIEEIAGGVKNGGSVKLLQTGGPLGGVLGPQSLSITLDFEEMAQAGAILGSGGIIVGGQDVCPVDLVRNLVAFCQFESCGKCFPCRLGMTNLLEILDRIAGAGGNSVDQQLMESIGRSMTLGSLCGHGQLGFNPVSSALRYFPDEFRTHIFDRRCPGGQCENLFHKPARTRPMTSEGWYARRDYAHN